MTVTLELRALQRSKRPLAAPSHTRCVETMKSTVTCRLEAAGIGAWPKLTQRHLPFEAERLSGCLPVRSTAKSLQGQPHQVGGVAVSFVVATRTVSNPLRHGELIFGLELLSLRLRCLPHEGGHAEQARSELATCMKQ